MKLEFFAPCEPPETTSQEKGAFAQGRRIIFFKKPETKAAEATLFDALRPFAPHEPLKGPVFLIVGFFRAYTGKTRSADGKPVWHSTRADWDNQSKLCCDVMAKLGFYENDSRIAVGIAVKLRVEPAHAGIYIHLSTMNDFTATEEDPVLTAIKAKITDYQEKHPNPAGTCRICYFRFCKQIPVAPGQVCHRCGTLSPDIPKSAGPDIVDDLEFLEDFTIDPNDLVK